MLCKRLRKWSNRLDDAAVHLTENVHNPYAVYYFVKALVLFFIFKLAFTWKPVAMALPYQHFVVPESLLGKIVFAPSLIAGDNIHLFYGLSLLVSTMILFIKPNYFCNTLFFWMVISFYRVTLPVINGSDSVLVVMSMLAIPLSFYPFSKALPVRQAQVATTNIFVWFIQVEICLIYFISGYDKLVSPVWRSGEALTFVAHLDTMIIDGTQDWLKNRVSGFMMAWATILFELLFFMGVWVRRTRRLTLLYGLVFHMAIGIMLNLPDFMVMTIPYLFFIRNEVYERMRIKIRRMLLS